MCGTEQVKKTFAFTSFQNGRQVSFRTVLQILCAKKTSLKAIRKTKLALLSSFFPCGGHLGIMCIEVIKNGVCVGGGGGGFLSISL